MTRHTMIKAAIACGDNSFNSTIAAAGSKKNIHLSCKRPPEATEMERWYRAVLPTLALGLLARFWWVAGKIEETV